LHKTSPYTIFHSRQGSTVTPEKSCVSTQWATTLSCREQLQACCTATSRRKSCRPATQAAHTIALATCVNYADLNNSMLRTGDRVSTGFFRCDVLFLQGNTMVFVLLL